MQIARLRIKAPARRAVATIASAPLMAALAVSSIGITLVVVLGTMHDGRLPATGSIGLVCALVLAAVAVAEACRPARSERARRRIGRPPALDEVASDDVSVASRWR
jgi:hypothetical protein